MRAKVKVECRVLAVLLATLGAPFVRAETFTINTPGGPVQVDISHVGPRGSLVSPQEPQHAGFRPPTIFSAPLPSGSGARALGLAGAFTAVADDATAASWNPAGLVQLALPEASVVCRASRCRNEHTSVAEDFQVGEDDFGNENLNYVSVVYPFRLPSRNAVFSLNYQEAYDFTQEFSARIWQSSSRTVHGSLSSTFKGTEHDHISNEHVDIEVTSYLTTHADSQLSQILASDLTTDLSFEQEGIIDAVTPAVAVNINSRLSVGLALNLYAADHLGRNPIRSRTTAVYSGASSSYATMIDERQTEGTYLYEGVWYRTTPGFPPVAVPIPPTPGTCPSFSDTYHSHEETQLWIEGTYEEVNTFNDLRGMNATLGLRWDASRCLTLGCTVDLPWTAEGRQEKSIRNRVTTYDQARQRVLDQSETLETVRKDIEMDFPLHWAVGALWRLNDVLYLSSDISRTRWSDFSFKAEGEERLNPLDGTLHGDNPIDDCWSARCGIEYLVLLNWTEIPLRGGVYWEQRPAAGEPDEYLGFSLGSGISLGKDPGKLILDAAYVYRRGDDVMGTLVPDQSELHTDVVEHQVYISSIWHF
ncbi:MAG: hypothetical protein JXB04_12900 [Kiritimatiellae bacterium]|nr:hypothetical protein [Kiritimatiellia bacterium]